MVVTKILRTYYDGLGGRYMAIWQFSFWIIPDNRNKDFFQDDEI